tara:strand:- start:194 stop:451 length:258 start_codon:yes stop_codon:yes gene_type:complete
MRQVLDVQTASHCTANEPLTFAKFCLQQSRTICDIVFVAEAKLDDIKLKDDFSSLSMIVCPAEKVESGHLGQFADKAGEDHELLF